jgi:hypothetical protein
MNRLLAPYPIVFTPSPLSVLISNTIGRRERAPNPRFSAN